MKKDRKRLNDINGREKKENLKWMVGANEKKSILALI